MCLASALYVCTVVVVLGTEPCGCGIFGANVGKSLFPGDGVDTCVLFKAPLCLNNKQKYVTTNV